MDQSSNDKVIENGVEMDEHGERSGTRDKYMYL